MTAAPAALRSARARWTAMADETTWQASLVKAVGFETAQHARNRLALMLVLFFIPAWLGLVTGILPGSPIEYQSRITGDLITVPANELGLMSAAINAVTLIVGFMMFAAMRRSSEFDQRLVLAGYSRSGLLLAKLVALVLVAVVVSAYAALSMTFFTDVHQGALLGLSLFASGLTYGGIGIVLGVAVSTELAGMFVIIMISLVDVMVQNPVINPGRDQTLVQFLPTYGAMQSGVAATFTEEVSARHLLLGPMWLVAFAIFGLVAFYARTRDHSSHSDAPPPAPPTAMVTLRTLPDGTMVVESRQGPILLCSHTDCELE
ncbi:hypothetical protein L3Q67_39625 [Saccharothrix sp. AJ9571]|nr:hypothetical protein L3Q67_39625 [Saccharothrix sp. AJ9571]